MEISRFCLEIFKEEQDLCLSSFLQNMSGKKVSHEYSPLLGTTARLLSLHPEGTPGSAAAGQGLLLYLGAFKVEGPRRL